MPTLTIWQGSRRQEVSFSPGVCLGDLLHGAEHAHPCGGRGVCGKCSVVLKGHSEPVLSCQTLLGDQDAEVYLPQTLPMASIALAGEVASGKAAGEVGAAIDIGTTTVALALFDLASGACLAQAGMLNPQTAIAADVIGRIDAAMKNQLETQRQLIISCLETLLSRACRDADLAPEAVRRRVITGNTTMLYLLTGRDPTSLSRAPFEADCLFDEEAPMGYLPPCMNAFVGADITCAVLHSGMCQPGGTALLCDLGTNGELALWKDGRLHVTSTAAGPVFEGASISCGVNSVPGAIDRVWVENGALRWHTLEDLPAVGLCGSGLLDAVAALLEIGMLDETGLLEDEPAVIAPGVSLTQKDIRAVQLAKAAIAAGIDTLLHQAGCGVQEVDRFYVAGGFGSHADLHSAAAIGMLPQALAEKVVVLGNAALRGAAQLLIHPQLREQAREIARQAVHVSLGGNPRFNNAYMDAMLFE